MGVPSLEVINERTRVMHTNIESIQTDVKEFGRYASAQEQINLALKDNIDKTQTELNTHKDNVEKKWKWVISLGVTIFLTVIGLLFTAISVFGS